MAPDAHRYSVANFLNSPRYDEIISNLMNTDESVSEPFIADDLVSREEIDLNQIDEVVFSHDGLHIGSSTMGKETLQAIFSRHDVKIPISDVEFIGLGAFNAKNIMIVTKEEFTTVAKQCQGPSKNVGFGSLKM